MQRCSILFWHRKTCRVVSIRREQDSRRNRRNPQSKFHAPVVCLIPVDDTDKVALIESLGADDFLFKPFNPREFACRVKILLRRSEKHHDAPSIERRSQVRRAEDRKRLDDRAGTTGSSVQIDNDKKLVWFDNRKIALTPKEYALFCLLASEPERVFSPQEIIEYLWSDCRRATASNVQQCIYMLRKKIEVDVKQPRWLITIKGFGYKLNFANT
jgi:two-component system alkaline phosphatase synthesis response regulator PhoP